jgi:glycosyltransferase involved in cell wall biosynthesis
MTRLLYVTADDAQNPTAENNAYYIGQALLEVGASLDFVHLRDFSLAEKIAVGASKLALRVRGYQYRAKADPRLMQRRAAHIRAQAQNGGYDLVLANSGPTALAASGGVPFAIYTDAPIVALKEMGHYLDDWARGKVRDYIDSDRAAVESAAITMYHSQWAADWAIRAYGVDPSRVSVVSPGANLPWVPVSDANLDKQRGEQIELLFFGRDWMRKGGPEAQEITRELVKQGVPARLHICGPKVRPKSTVDDPNLVWHPPINKLLPNDFERLKQLMREMDYLLLPTRADTSTSAIREASAFGIPSVVTAVGGLPEMVKDNESGFLIGDDRSLAIALRILENYRNDHSRLTFRSASRHQYDVRMNWTVAAKGINAALDGAAS